MCQGCGLATQNGAKLAGLVRWVDAALRARLAGSQIGNSWDIWVFPKPNERPRPDVVVTDDWDASAKHLVETLDKFKVPQAEKDELLAFVGTLKKDIVDK